MGSLNIGGGNLRHGFVVCFHFLPHALNSPIVDYNALLSLSRGSILTEVVLFWGLFLESIFLF